jgi:hypothetical protein
MAAAYNLNGSPLAMSKIKKKVVETMAAISERSSLADCCVYRNLMEAKNRLGILIKRLGSDVALERKPAATKTTAPPAARGTKRPSAKRSDDRRRACKKRATADAKEAREKQLKLSEVDITFDIADCKDRADLSGRNAIVLQPLVSGHRIHDVLIDGGSSLDVLAAKVLDKLHISRSKMDPVTRSFQGAIPGVTGTTIGQIRLSVQLGTPENCRVEDVLFDVVDSLPGPMTAILGRPAIAKFMAVLHHAYQCAKMPGPNGVITLQTTRTARRL